MPHQSGGNFLSRRLIGLILDGLQLSKWQADALLRIGDTAEFVVYNCTNTAPRRQLLKHAGYYAFNLVSLKSEQTRQVPLPEVLRIRQTISFDAEADGAWQRLPSSVISAIADHDPELIIKFGMGLLRVPEAVRCPILSYHHGDPRRFRGRPAGFYEVLAGEPVVGQIVQILSNRLDAGAVVAFAETRVQPESYKGTMLEAYRASPLILPRAIENALSGTTLAIEPKGRNFRLPSNLTTMRFGVRLLGRKIRRLFYGLLIEKQWQVAEAELTVPGDDFFSHIPPRAGWRVTQRPSAYRFLADPFPHPGGGLLVEALRSSDQQGEIVHLNGERTKVLCAARGHFSYPGTLAVNGSCYLLPESSEWTEPRLYRLTEDGAEDITELDIAGRPRLVDPTLHVHSDGTIYLFANDARDGQGVLRLWVGDDLLGKFSEHPSSPVRISPVGARMAGALIERSGRLYRPGQDGSGDYGDGIVLFEVAELTRTTFREREIKRLRFEEVRGPHTLNLRERTAIFDYYEERFTPRAGLNRLRAAVSKARAR